MAFWLMKTNPELFNWDMLTENGKTRWDGVRNYQARNNLREMKPGDLAFMFHMEPEPGAMGVMKIVSEAYDDPESSEGNWAVIDVEPVVKIERPVSQDEIRNTPMLNVLPLKSQPKLSVMPVSEEQWDLILRIGKTELPK
jgi:predicted RNA-binding protein with PUA-like domain